MTTKQQRALLRAESRKWPRWLEEIPEKDWPESMRLMNLRPIRVLRSRDFLVQIYDELHGNIRISVNRTDQNPDGSWKDGITWDELYQIKNQAGYGAHIAIEIYPPEKHLVNVANIRHLWVLGNPSKIPLWEKID